MSTKTTFKRIALVAVASLGFGLLSAAPSSAGAITTATGGTVVTSISTPVRTSHTTWTANVALEQTTAATPVAGDTYAATVAVTDPGNAGDPATATIPTYTLTAADLFSAKVSKFTVVMTITAASASIADVLEASKTVAVTLTVGTVAAAAATTITAPPLSATGIFTEGVAFSQTTPAALTQIVNGQATLKFIGGTGDTNYTITSTGVGTIQSASSTTTAPALLGAIPSSGYSWTPITNRQTLSVVTTSTVAGTQTVSFQPIGASGVPSAPITATITWGATPTVSPSLTTVFAAQGNARAAALETTAMRLPSTAAVAMSSTATSGVSIAITVRDADGNNLNGQSVSATISGPGLISLASGNVAANAGNVRAASLTAATQRDTHQSTVGVSGDGTRGVGTITITVGGTAVYTKTVTFYGAVATLTATQGVSIMSSGRTATSDAASFVLGNTVANTAAASTAVGAVNIRIVAADVDGNVVPLAGSAITADISDTAVIDLVTITDCAGTVALTAALTPTICAVGAGNYVASTRSAIGGVSGAKATVTFKTAHPTVAGTFISSAALPFSLGGSKTGGTVTMTLDKATYEPGEKMVITYTAKDAAGNPVADWTSTGTPTANKAATVAGGVYVNGSHIYGDGATEVAYAPVAPGPFTVTLASGTSSTATLTATATVADDAATTAAAAAGDAAAEATDAANAATDAANAAAEAADAATAAAQDAADAVAALSTSVTAMVDSLRKQITSLTNLVIKIQKKVRA